MSTEQELRTVSGLLDVATGLAASLEVIHAAMSAGRPWSAAEVEAARDGAIAAAAEARAAADEARKRQAAQGG